MKYITCNTKIAVIGSSNICTQFACVCASKGYEVNLYSSKPELYDGAHEVIDESRNKTVGNLNKVCANIPDAIDVCSIIIIPHPAFRLKEVANQIQSYTKAEGCIRIISGTGSAD